MNAVRTYSPKSHSEKNQITCFPIFSNYFMILAIVWDRTKKD